MATNTSFADFPRLSALLAADGFLPRQLTYRGSRLVYSRGIVTLALIASLLIVVFNASVSGLIPLYAIGVFLSFTLSQTGMARRWWKIGHLQMGQEVKERGSTLRYEPRWRPKMLINAFGAVCTAIVMLVFAVTKFTEGAWIVLLLMPILVVVFSGIHRHYRDLAAQIVARTLRRATARLASMRHHSPQRRPSWDARGLTLCAFVVVRYHRRARVDRPRRGRSGAAEVGVVGRRRTPGDS